MSYIFWPVENNNAIRTGRHCVFKMHVHLFFVTKYRKKVLDGKAIEILRESFTKVCRDFEAELTEMDEIANRYYKNVLWSPSYFAASCSGAPISIARQYVEQQTP